jgi:hypothetical protein
MKAKLKSPAASGGKSARNLSRRKAPVPSATKSGTWRGFAPELCAIMTGPSDLSMREGFARG